MKKLISMLLNLVFIVLISCGQNANSGSSITKLEGAPAPFDGSKKMQKIKE